MLLSIIIPSYNTHKLLKNCLNSIYKETKNINFELIVVDNNSQDGSVKMLKKNFPEIKLIENKENLGYAKANNKGIKKAIGKYILLLNSDTIVLNKAITKSIDFMRQRNDVDILGCKLLNKDNSLQPSGGFFPSLGRIFYMMFFIDDLPFFKNILKAYQMRDGNFYKKNQKLDWVTGAFLLLKKEVLESIKGFDEDFFMYGEEVDFCFRAKKAGNKVWFYKDAEIIHLKGQSSIDGFEKAVVGEYKGLLKFFNKHKQEWQLSILKFLLKIGACFRMVVFGILGDKAKRRVYEKAIRLV